MSDLEYLILEIESQRTWTDSKTAMVVVKATLVRTSRVEGA